MKQVIQSARNGKLEVKEVPPPKAGTREILVRTTASLISAGTERMVVDFAKKSMPAKAKARPDLVKKILTKAKTDGVTATFKAVMSRLDEPLPLGYSAAGSVVEVGEGLEGSFRVGDRVAISGAGIANHAEFCAVPRNLAAPIPEGVSDQQACYGTLSAIALHAVRNLDPGLGDMVAVLGLGLIGQLACQLLGVAGARAIAIDYDDERLKTAKSNGAELAINLQVPDLINRVMSHTSGRGCDGILIAAATPSNHPFETAADLARDRARVCLVGFCGTEFPYAPFMQKELSIIVSRSYGPGRYDEDYENRDVKYPEGFVRWTETENLTESLRLMSPTINPRLNIAALTTHNFEISEAEKAYKLVIEKSEPHLGIVLTYRDTKQVPNKPSQHVQTSVKNDACVLGVIGGGNFARNTLLPAISKVPDAILHTLVTKRGASADFSQNKFGFTRACSEENDIFENPSINAVLVASRHNSHARLTVEALSAGKSVLVEKPLGLNKEELQAIRLARKDANAFFQVGFNRRFAPLAVKARNMLAAISGPRFMVFRINAGSVPVGSWLHSPNEGGGRIIGEMCHFIDLARFFANKPIVSVMADSPRSNNNICDDVTATLRFDDGGLGVVVYTSLGDNAYPKENYEIYAGGSVIALNNFRTLTVTSGGTTQKSGINQDKGYKSSLIAFVEAVKSGGPAPIDEEELLETSQATLAILESLRTGRRVML